MKNRSTQKYNLDLFSALVGFAVCVLMVIGIQLSANSLKIQKDSADAAETLAENDIERLEGERRSPASSVNFWEEWITTRRRVNGEEVVTGRLRLYLENTADTPTEEVTICLKTLTDSPQVEPGVPVKVIWKSNEGRRGVVLTALPSGKPIGVDVTEKFLPKDFYPPSQDYRNGQPFPLAPSVSEIYGSNGARAKRIDKDCVNKAEVGQWQADGGGGREFTQ